MSQRPLPIGDIKDGRAYVASVLRARLPRLFDEDASPDTVDDMIGEGLALLAEWHTAEPRGSLHEIAGARLGNALIDRWRHLTPEWRRNARAGKASLIVATGLAHEHLTEDGQVSDPPGGYGWVSDDEALRDSRLALSIFRGAPDFSDPRIIGKLVGVPSWRVPPPGVASDVAKLAEDERDGYKTDEVDADRSPTEPPGFYFSKDA
jgi:hypothetical protein